MLKKHFTKYLKYKNNTSKLMFLAAFVVFSFLGLNYTTSSVSAADPVLTYCQGLDLTKDALKICTTKNVDYARNTATYKCDSETSSDKKVSCVESKAKSYFKAAAQTSPKPNTALKMSVAFDAQITKALKGTGGSRNKPAAGFGSLAPDAQTCQGGSCSDPAADPNAPCDKDRCDFIKKYVNPTINLLTISFGLIAVASLIFGGIQYSASTGDPQKVSKAKDRIVNTIIAIVAYFFLYGFLQFLIPGGAFNR